MNVAGKRIKTKRSMEKFNGNLRESKVNEIFLKIAQKFEKQLKILRVTKTASIFSSH